MAKLCIEIVRTLIIMLTEERKTLLIMLMALISHSLFSLQNCTNKIILK